MKMTDLASELLRETLKGVAYESGREIGKYKKEKKEYKNNCGFPSYIVVDTSRHNSDIIEFLKSTLQACDFLFDEVDKNED